MGMKRQILLSILTALVAMPLWAQREDDFHEALRYEQMNQQGVWAVGLGIEPVVGLTHPVSYTYGNGRETGAGSFGLHLEGSYFIVDNMSIVASFGYVSNSWATVMRFNYMDAATTLSSRKFRLGGRWHMGRWFAGGGLLYGRSALTYTSADLENGGVNIPIYGEESFYNPRPVVGLYYEGGFQVNPFFKTSLFFEPALTTYGGRYSHSFGARLTIYLPFMDAVVCR